MRCGLCRKEIAVITNTHVGSFHGISLSEYRKRFPHQKTGFPISVGQLPKRDPRYKKWLLSLQNRPPPWSKGHTKETHPSVAKISDTFLRKKIDNFAQWRKKARRSGFWKPPVLLQHNQHLAELIGVIWGDGNIFQFPRTEGLTIASNALNRGFIKRYAKLMEKVFQKQPYLSPPNRGCVKIRIYQKDISKRLKIPVGNKGNVRVVLPRWILRKREFMVACLRGLYEAEGYFSIHKPTSTYKFAFTNKNIHLLRLVYKLVKELGFNPLCEKNRIMLSRKKETFKFKALIRFRDYQ